MNHVIFKDSKEKLIIDSEILLNCDISHKNILGHLKFGGHIYMRPTHIHLIFLDGGNCASNL